MTQTRARGSLAPLLTLPDLKISHQEERACGFSLNHGCAFEVLALALEEGWVLLEARLPGKKRAAREMLPVCLEWNRELEGSIRWTLDPEGCLLLRAEIPGDLPGDQGPRFRVAVSGLEKAWRQWGGLTTTGSEDAPGEAEDALAMACEEAGWPCTRRQGGWMAARLDVPGDSLQVVLEPRPAPRARVKLAAFQFQGEAPCCGEALAVLMLSAGHQVRLARPLILAGGTLFGSGGCRTPAFEVGLTPRPTADEVHHALAALSMACRLCHREVPLLQNESLARDYLGLRGWPV